MKVGRGFTDAEIREIVHEYGAQPHGQKAAWLAARGVAPWTLQRWRSALFEGDLDRGLVPREGSPVTVPPAKRTALDRERARERAAHAAEIARLTARVKELEDTNEALGKAIGLLHNLNEHEPAANTTTEPETSSPRRTS